MTQKSNKKVTKKPRLLHMSKKSSNFAGKIGLKEMQQPNLYIIAGPNRAGKTTASFSLLPDVLHCLNFVNADKKCGTN